MPVFTLIVDYPEKGGGGVNSLMRNTNTIHASADIWFLAH